MYVIQRGSAPVRRPVFQGLRMTCGVTRVVKQWTAYTSRRHAFRIRSWGPLVAQTLQGKHWTSLGGPVLPVRRFGPLFVLWGRKKVRNGSSGDPKYLLNDPLGESKVAHRDPRGAIIDLGEVNTLGKCTFVSRPRAIFKFCRMRLWAPDIPKRDNCNMVRE